jgi:hypothetical protein
VLFTALIGLVQAPLEAAQAVNLSLFCVFLKDGRVLTSYGEWARLDSRVVFSMPTRRGDPASELHLVSIPENQVDWERTTTYADTVKAAAYSTTRGEMDFARLSDEVARTLNEVALITDPAERLVRAELARKALNEWPGAHYGYRAADVRDILGMLDEVIAEMRAASGLGRFDLALVAPPAIRPDESLLPEPTEAETVEQLMTAASLAETPAARGSLLQSVLGLLDRAADLLPEAWAAMMRVRASDALEEEKRLDTAYAALRARTLQETNRRVARADVRSLERLRKTVLDGDRRLGHKRPGEIAALISTVEAGLESARTLRLAQDQFELLEPRFRRYERAVNPSVNALVRSIPSLEDVKALAGPPPSTLTGLVARWRRDGRRLAAVVAPPELDHVHALFRTAWQMAEQAFSLRLSAVAANDVDGARRASSAAAGALMLLSRARADFAAALTPPSVP